MTVADSRPATRLASSNGQPPAGSDLLSGQITSDIHPSRAAEGQGSPQANDPAQSIQAAPAGTNGSRPAMLVTETNLSAPAGPDSLSGQGIADIQWSSAAEGQDSPQAIRRPAAIELAPAGSNASHGHRAFDTHAPDAVAAHVPGGQFGDDHHVQVAAGDSDPARPVAILPATSTAQPPPAGLSPAQKVYKALALAAAVLDDQEKVRIRAENRFRQLTRTEPDKDGEVRGAGFTPDDPAVRYLADLVLVMKCDSGAVWDVLDPGGKHRAGARCLDNDGSPQPVDSGRCLEHRAEHAVTELLARTPLSSFATDQGAGVGSKQLARLLGATGDPYLRAPTYYADGTLVPGSGEPRTLSQWRAYCGHGDPARKPFKGMSQEDAFRLGNRAAKMRAHLIAEQCIRYKGDPDKNGRPTARSRYRDTYDAAKDLYADRVHELECRNASRISPNGCGTREHPEWGEIGSPWRDGHRHAAALRLVAKHFLDELYAEAKRLHEQA